MDTTNTNEQTGSEQAAEQFHIDSTERADWYLRKLANIEAERTRVQAQAAKIIAQLDSDADSLRGRFQAELEQFTRQELARTHSRRKSLTLLQGTCSFRTVPAAVRVSDADIALQHAQTALPDLVITRQVLDAAEYRQAAQNLLQAHGELLPGVEVVPERESFNVRFGKAQE